MHTLVCAELHAKCHVTQPAKALWCCAAILPDPEPFLSLSRSRARLSCCIYLGKEMRWKCNPADGFNSSSTPGTHHSPDWQPCPRLTQSFKVLLVYTSVKVQSIVRSPRIFNLGWRRVKASVYLSAADKFVGWKFSSASCKSIKREAGLPRPVMPNVPTAPFTIADHSVTGIFLFPLSAETRGQNVCFIVKERETLARTFQLIFMHVHVDFGNLVCDREDRNGKEMLLRVQ